MTKAMAEALLLVREPMPRRSRFRPSTLWAMRSTAMMRRRNALLISP
ncbi:hypothetical protein ACMDCR_12660 [Labrys okinawensis]